MPEFSYRALDKDGELQAGKLQAFDRGVAVSELHRMGFTPLDVLEKPTFLMRLNEPVTFFDKPSERDIQGFLRDLARLLEAGLSIDETLNLLERMQTRELLKRAIGKIREKVRQGETLAEALSGYDDYFNIQVVAAVKAGEYSGTLPETLSALSRAMDQALSFKERVKGALIYPAILMVMVAVTFVLVMTFVLPQFAPLFDGNEDKLPWMTRFVLGLGDIFMAYWYVGAAFFVLAAVWAIQLMRDKQKLEATLKVLSSIPFLKDWLIAPDIIRFTRTLSVCTNGGVPLDQGLAMSVSTVKIPHIREALADLRANVRKGGLLSHSLITLDWVSPVVVQFVRVGEQSGKLGPMLDEASQILSQGYENRLEKGLEVLSPVLTLIMGGIIALLVGSVLLGIMSINDVAF